MRSFGLVLVLIGCSENEVTFHPAISSEGDGTIAGRICDPETQTWLEGAMAYTNITDSTGLVIDTRTALSDEEGHWVLEDIPGDARYDVWVQYGNEVLDFAVVTVDSASNPVVLPDPPCFDNGDATIAVVTGGWDDLASLLPEFGFPSYTIVNGQAGDEIVEFLSNADALAEFDTLYFDGGHLEDGIFYGGNGDGTVTLITDNLAAYVENGGRVFATDWAYDVIERVWPSQIDFFGDDTVADAAQTGEPGTLAATLLNPDLELLAGDAKVDVLYDASEYPLVEATDPSVDVLMTAKAPYRVGFDVFTIPASPLAVRFFAGDGEVVFTSWRIMSNSSSEMLPVARALVAGDI